MRFILEELSLRARDAGARLSGKRCPRVFSPQALAEAFAAHAAKAFSARNAEQASAASKNLKQCIAAIDFKQHHALAQLGGGEAERALETTHNAVCELAEALGGKTASWGGGEVIAWLPMEKRLAVVNANRLVMRANKALAAWAKEFEKASGKAVQGLYTIAGLAEFKQGAKQYFINPRNSAAEYFKKLFYETVILADKAVEQARKARKHAVAFYEDK